MISIYSRLWKRNLIPTHAAALTYTLILALAPAMAVCLSVLHLVADLRKVNIQFKAFLLKNLTFGVGSTISHHLDAALDNIRFKTIGYVGFFTLLLTLLLLLHNIEKTVNQIWNIKKKRPIWKSLFIYSVFLVAGPIMVALLVGSTTLITNIAPELLKGTDLTKNLFLKAGFGVLIVNTVFLIMALKMIPYTRVSWRNSLLVGIFTGLLMELAKWVYAYYTTTSLLNNKIYGGLAALPVFLVWIYLNWLLFLSSCQFVFVLQNRKRYF